jgi:hypothetical protein
LPPLAASVKIELFLKNYATPPGDLSITDQQAYSFIARRESMTKPRRQLADQVSLLSRRCFQSTFFLRPDDYINQVMGYEMGRAANRHGQVIHGAMAMSNHVYQVSLDTKGDRSAYMRDFLREVSRARNHHLGREDSLWDGRPYGDAILLDRESIEENLLDMWLYPVEAGLVRKVAHWPGFKILPKHWGKPMSINRPGGYHSEKSPATVEFIPMPPPGFAEMSLEEVRKYFEAKIEAREEAIYKRRNNQKVLGRTRICQTEPTSRPKSALPKGKFRSRIAAKDRDIRQQARALHSQFQRGYQRARLKWLSKKKAEFPCGTVQLKRCAPIHCKPPDDDEPGLFRITRKIG